MPEKLTKTEKRNYAHTNKRRKNITRENPGKHAGTNEAGGELSMANLAGRGATVGKRSPPRRRR